MERALRIWVGLVGTTALAHGVRSLVNENYLKEMIFTLRPELGANSERDRSRDDVVAAREAGTLCKYM